MTQLLDGIARELGDHGITVNAYAAGAVETRLRQTNSSTSSRTITIRRLRDPFVGAQSMISFKLMTQVPEVRLVPAIYDFAQLQILRVICTQFLDAVAIIRMGEPEDITHLVSYLVSMQGGRLHHW